MVRNPQNHYGRIGVWMLLRSYLGLFFKMMCICWVWPKHAFHLQQNHQESSNKEAWGWPRRVWGVLKLAACGEVQRQLSVVVNANTHLHNGKINGALWGINLHRVRPAYLLLGCTIWGWGSWKLKWEAFTGSFFSGCWELWTGPTHCQILLIHLHQTGSLHNNRVLAQHWFKQASHSCLVTLNKSTNAWHMCINSTGMQIHIQWIKTQITQ